MPLPMKMHWVPAVIGTEGSPILLADLDVYATWGGAGEGSTDFARIVLEHGYDDPADVVPFGDHGVGLFDTDGGGPVDIGSTSSDLIVLMCDSNYDERPKRKARLLKALETHKFPEYLVGQLELRGRGLVVSDSAEAGTTVPAARDQPTVVGRNGYFVPRSPGTYVLLEGVNQDDDGWQARWCRVVPSGDTTYERRPQRPPDDPVQSILQRVTTPGTSD